MSHPGRIALCALLCQLLAGCRGETEADVADGSATTSSRLLLEADDADIADAGAQMKGSASEAGMRVSIPKGKLVAGSTPGDRGRDPTLEPALQVFELKAFDVDKLPYPNDPGEAVLTGVSRTAAGNLCVERGGRLCNELEWERACKGPDDHSYAGGDRWDPSCATAPQTCASGFGVLGMGAAMREWTASDVAPIPKLQPGAAAVRGARLDAAAVDHRCAHRMGVAAETTTADLGFRCCYGPANDAALSSPKFVDTIKRVSFRPERLGEMFASNPKLELLKNDIKYFREDAATDTVLRRGRARGTDAGSIPANTYITTSPVIWNPVPGEEILLVTGRSGDRNSFIVAFHRLPDDRYRVGSAMIMKDEVGPVVLVYNPYTRRKLHWTTCWECYGETGNITYREENRVTITQR